MVAAIAEAVIEPRSRGCSSVGGPFHPVAQALRCSIDRSSLRRGCAIAPRGASASHTSNGMSRRRPRSARPVRGVYSPCAAITPTSVRSPRNPSRGCVRARPTSPATRDASASPGFPAAAPTNRIEGRVTASPVPPHPRRRSSAGEHTASHKPEALSFTCPSLIASRAQ